MKKQSDFWLVRLTSAAEDDLDQILQWTAERFGKKQADGYAETLLTAAKSLTAGPMIAGVKSRNDLPSDIFTLSATRSGKKARHVFLFRAEPRRDKNVIQVLRILHDAMDIPRHLNDYHDDDHDDDA